MKELLRSRHYNSGKRPSGHNVGKKSFLRDNGGSIPSNVLSFSNTSSTDAYQEYCRQNDLKLHPARMQTGLAEFFIKFLTRPGDLVLDPFAGSNTTGAMAEALGRKWVSVEANKEYVRGSRGRFQGQMMRRAS
jgi:DNA modification methylase